MEVKQFYNCFVPPFVEILKLCLFAFCLSCCVWQVHVCLSKYASKPGVTTVYYDQVKDLPTMTFSICQELESWQGSMLEDLKTMAFLQHLWGWDTEAKRWEMLFMNATHVVQNDEVKKFRKHILPISESKASVCFTYDHADFVKFRSIILEVELFLDLQIYFHQKNRLSLLGTTNQKFSLGTHITKYYKVDMSYTKLLSTSDYPCQIDVSSQHDICVEQLALREAVTKAGCLPKLITLVNQSVTVCQTSNDSQLAQKVYYDTFWNDSVQKSCILPCNFFQVSIDFKKYLNIKKKFASIKKFATGGLQLFELPVLVEVTETVPLYDLTTFIAETGGWLGLFLGISVLQTTFWGISRLETSIQKSLTRYNIWQSIIRLTKLIITMASFIIVLCVGYKCVNKFNSHLSGSTISYKKLEQPISITFCQSKAIYVSETDGNDYTIFGRNSIIKETKLNHHYADLFEQQNLTNTFWQKGVNIMDWLVRIETKKKAAKRLKTVWYTRKHDPMTSRVFSIFTFPSEADKMVEFCFSLDPQLLQDVIEIKVTTRGDDVYFSVHRKGQFYLSALQSVRPTNLASNSEMVVFDRKPKYENQMYSLEIVNIDLSHQLNHQCQDKIELDKCIHQFAFAKMLKTAGCSVPFGSFQLGSQPNMSTCPSAKAEMLALAAYTSGYYDSKETFIKCLKPCKYMKTKLNKPESLGSSRKNKVEVTLKMPKLAEHVSSFATYEFINLISEFGGWVSLVVGVSLLDLTDVTACILAAAKKKTLETTIKFLLKQQKLFYLILFTFCSLCLSWQFTISFDKLLSNPTATNIYYRSVNSDDMPVFSFCGYRGTHSQFYSFYKHFNKSNLNDIYNVVELARVSEKLAGKWKTIWFVENSTLLPGFLVSKKVTYKAGLFCKTYLITGQAPQGLSFVFKDMGNLNVFVYPRNTFFKSPLSLKFTKKSKQKAYTYKMTIESMKLLPTQDYNCTADDNQFDRCIADKIGFKMLSRVGCVAPFSPSLDRYCTNATAAITAMKSYQEFLVNQEIGKSACGSSCELTKFSKNLQTVAARQDTQGSLAFMFPASVKVTEVSYYYSFINFVAEFGGWSGVLLGLSVMELSTILTKMKTLGQTI